MPTAVDLLKIQFQFTPFESSVSEVSDAVLKDGEVSPRTTTIAEKDVGILIVAVPPSMPTTR